jgi:hypothetical protein
MHFQPKPNPLPTNAARLGIHKNSFWKLKKRKKKDILMPKNRKK